MKKIVVSNNDSGQRLDKFIFKFAPELPKSMLYKMIRKKDVKLNSKRVVGNEILTEGDLIEIYIHDNFLKNSKKALTFTENAHEIIPVYEDKNILIVNKPRGVIVHKSVSTDHNLTDDMLNYLYNNKGFDPVKEKSFTPAFCNRLDRNTNGYLLAAKNFPTLQMLNSKIKNKEITRKYIALVKGKALFKNQTFTRYHKKNEQKKIAIISKTPKPDFKEMISILNTIKVVDGFSLIEVEIITGRFHQIRAQLADLGFPIVGDKKYGSKEANKQQLLTSYYIGFDFTTDAAHLNYLKNKIISMTVADNFFSSNK